MRKHLWTRDIVTVIDTYVWVFTQLFPLQGDRVQSPQRAVQFIEPCSREPGGR